MARDTFEPQPSANLHAQPAAIVAAIILNAVLRETKAKHRERYIARIKAVCAQFERGPNVFGIHDREPYAQAQARADAAEALRRLLEREKA